MDAEVSRLRFTDRFGDINELRVACLLAVPKVVDHGLARRLTSRSDAAVFLDRLVTLGFGVTSDDSAQVVLEPAMRHDARSLLRVRWRSDFIEASRIAAQWHIERGDYAQALDHALDSEDIALIGHVGIRAWPPKGKARPYVLDRVRALPADLVRENAPLSLWLASQLVESPDDSGDARAHLRAAIAAARDRPAVSDSENLLLLGIEALAHSRLNDRARSAARATSFAARFRAASAARRIDISLAGALVDVAYELAAALIRDHAYTLASALIATLSAFCSALELTEQRTRTQALKIFLDVCTGRCRRAAAALERTAARPSSDYATLARLAKAIFTMDLDDLRDAMTRIDPDGGTTRRWELVLFGAIVLDLAEGDATTARARYVTAVAERSGENYDSGHRRCLSAIAITLTLAGVPVRPVVPLTSDNDSMFLTLRAIVDFHRDGARRAEDSITRAATAADTPLQRHSALVLLTRFACRSGDDQLLRSTARELNVIYELHGVCGGLVLLTADDRERLVGALGTASPLAAAIRGIPVFVRSDQLPDDTALTGREIEVLTALAQLGDRRAVAERLFLAPSTIKVYLRSIYRKLGVHSESEALRRAALLGLVRPERR